MRGRYLNNVSDYTLRPLIIDAKATSIAAADTMYSYSSRGYAEPRCIVTVHKTSVSTSYKYYLYIIHSTPLCQSPCAFSS